MSIVTIDGERASTEVRTEDWYDFRAAAFERLRKAPAAIDDLRALVEYAVGVAAYAIIRGSPWDEETEAALETAQRGIIAELMGNEPYHPTPEEQQDAWATEHECYRLGLMP